MESGDFNNQNNWTQVSYDPPFIEIKCSDTPPVAPDFASGLDPGNGNPAMRQGSIKNTYWFIDTKDVKPNRKYWYKIVSLDYLQNPKKGSQYLLDSTSPMMSTFTYDQYVNESLTLQPPTYNDQKGVILTWNQPSGATNISYLLYRSSKSADDGFTPLAKLNVNNYTDPTAGWG